MGLPLVSINFTLLIKTRIFTPESYFFVDVIYVLHCYGLVK